MMDKLNGCIFLIEDDHLLKNYKTIWDKFNADIKEEFDKKHVNNKNYLKPKIEAQEGEVTGFYDKEILIILVHQ